MIEKIIKKQTTLLYNQTNVRKFEITEAGLSRIFAVKPRAQQLLFDILVHIGYRTTIEDIIVKMTYRELGFNSYQNWKRYKNELVEQDLLYEEDGEYFVNPVFINFYTRRQAQFLFNWYGVKKQERVTMTIPKLKVVNQ